MVKQTNKKAYDHIQKLQNSTDPKDKYTLDILIKDWKETNIIEMKAYIAVLLYQGMARLPEAIDHWGPYDLF